jgi:predicted dehydrogenase
VKKILLIGLGSVGRRHLNVLKDIKDVKIAALRTLKGTLKQASGITEFFNQEDALKFDPDGVIISNPTSLHIETANCFLKHQIPVLIEKPIADNITECNNMEEFAPLIRVAYCTRFHPIFSHLVHIITNEKPFKLGFKRSFYLPKWHPYADYRTEYTARKDLGGGVVRTLSHEIDMMIKLFGLPVSVKGVVDKISHLEIDTDDFAFFTCSYKGNIRVNFELDFFSPYNINQGELFTQKGKYDWDLLSGLWFTPYDETDKNLMQAFSIQDIEKMYVEEISDFLGFISGKQSINSSLEEALEVLKVIEKIDGNR